MIDTSKYQERINKLEDLEVEGTNTREEFEYLLLTDYSIRADSFLVTKNGTIKLYEGDDFSDIELNPNTFRTRLSIMIELLEKYGFRKIYMRTNVSEEVMKLENKITEALRIAKKDGLEAVIKYLEKENDKINKSYE